MKEDTERMQAWCKRQLTPHNSTDLDSAMRKLEALASRITDNEIVLIHKRVAAHGVLFEPQDFGDFINAISPGFKLSCAEVSALVVKYDHDETYRVNFKLFFDDNLSHICTLKARRRRDRIEKLRVEREMCKQRDIERERRKAEQAILRSRTAPFTPVDELTAKKKLADGAFSFCRERNEKIEPGHSGWDAYAASLAGSDAAFLPLGSFTHLLRKFGVLLTPAELGATAQRFSGGILKDGTELVRVQDFVAQFITEGNVRAKQLEDDEVWRKLRAMFTRK